MEFGPGSHPLDRITYQHDLEFQKRGITGLALTPRRIGPDLRAVARLWKDPYALSIPFPVQIGPLRRVAMPVGPFGGWATVGEALRSQPFFRLLPVVGGPLERAWRGTWDAWRNL